MIILEFPSIYSHDAGITTREHLHFQYLTRDHPCWLRVSFTISMSIHKNYGGINAHENYN